MALRNEIIFLDCLSVRFVAFLVACFDDIAQHCILLSFGLQEIVINRLSFGVIFWLLVD